MIDYTPRGKIRDAILFIDEEGAQYSDVLAAHIGTRSKNLPDVMERAVAKGIVGSVCRLRDGKRISLWFLTPEAEECVNRLRQQEAVEA